MAGERIDVAAIIDQQTMNGFQLRLLLWIALAMFVEGYDMQVVGYAAPSIIRAWHVERSSFGLVFAAAMAGYMVGALALSNLGDRIGRRVLVIVGVLGFGALTVAAAYAQTPVELTALRFLAGVGLGGAIPNAIALAAEYAPSGQRATRVALVFAAYTLGSAAGGFIAAGLLPRFGWQSVFHVGGWSALLLGVGLVFALPESARFLASTGRNPARLAGIMRRLAPGLVVKPGAVFTMTDEAKPSRSVVELFRGGLLPVTCLLWAAYIFNMVALHFVTSWLPTIVQASGISLAYAAIAAGVFHIGGTAGSLVSGRLLDKYGIIWLAAVFFAGIPIVAAVGLAAGSAPLTIVLVMLAGLCIPGGQCGINALASTLYPTAIRSTGAGWALGIGRLGSILGPVLGSVLLAGNLPYGDIFLLLAVPPLLTGLALTLLALVRRPTRQRDRVGAMAAS